MTTKAKGESVRQKLIALAKKLEVKYRDIETVFLIERLVARLIADKKLANNLVFKGGFVCMRVYESPRYTVDLDALLVKSNIDQTLEQVKKQAEVNLNDGVWFQFDSQVDLVTQGEYGGFRHVYRAGIGEILKNIKSAQIINFDLGVGDPITPGPQKIEVNSLIGNETISWSVYPIETICAEKLHALISHGDHNSRSKDVHDLAIFLPKVNLSTLKKAIQSCLDFRETKVPKSFLDVVKKLNTSRLQKGWASAVASISTSKSFDEGFQDLVNELKKIEGRW